MCLYSQKRQKENILLIYIIPDEANSLNDDDSCCTRGTSQYHGISTGLDLNIPYQRACCTYDDAFLHLLLLRGNVTNNNHFL